MDRQFIFRLMVIAGVVAALGTVVSVKANNSHKANGGVQPTPASIPHPGHYNPGPPPKAGPLPTVKTFPASEPSDISFDNYIDGASDEDIQDLLKLYKELHENIKDAWICNHHPEEC